MKSLVLLVLLISSFSSLACRCPEIISIESKFAQSDFVYFGRIINSELLSDEQVVNELELIESFKGTFDPKLISDVSKQRCETPSLVGVTYIVYGNYGEDTKLTMCSYTQPHSLFWAEEFEKELAALRKLANK